MKTDEVARKAMELGAIQKYSELHPFIELIGRNPPGVVVEIGTARGGTFYALCQAARPTATVISIDMPGGKFGGGYTYVEADRKFSAYGCPKQKLHFIREDSHKKSTLAELRKLLNGRPVDLLVIDGDHTYKGAKADWEMYSPLVKKGGIVAFHDILFHRMIPDCQVDKVWNEAKLRHKHLEIIDVMDDAWGGIGVIYYGIKPLKVNEEARGLLLDISPVPVKQEHFIGMGGRPHPNVDILHDLEKLPWPVKDDSCHIVVGRQVMQKIKPWLFIPVMDELWRVMRPKGQLVLSVPYPGSAMFWADPANCSGLNETSFYFLDPDYKDAYAVYQPRPWKIEPGFPQWNIGGTLEIIMRARK